MLTECIIFTMKMKKPQKTTTMKVIKTTEGKLRLISYKEANYDEALTARIQDL